MSTRSVLKPSGILFTAVLLAACGGGEEQAEVVPLEDPAAAPMEAAPPAPGQTPPGTAPAAAPATTPAAGPDTAGSGLPAGVTAEMVTQGQQLFTSTGICFTCHGPDASGTALAPDLTDDEWIWVDPSSENYYDELVTLIETGVSQPEEHPAPMPSGSALLSEEQLRAVAAYVYSLTDT